MTENEKVILTGHIIHSYGWRSQERETQQILFTAYSSVWQLVLTGISSIFQAYPSFSCFNLILLASASEKCLSFLFWKWYYLISFKPRIAKQFSLPHLLQGFGERHLEKASLFPALTTSAPALWESAWGPMDNSSTFSMRKSSGIRIMSWECSEVFL